MKTNLLTGMACIALLSACSSQRIAAINNTSAPNSTVATGTHTLPADKSSVNTNQQDTILTEVNNASHIKMEQDN